MFWIFLIFIGFIVGFTLLLKLSLMLMGRIAGRQIGEKHKAAEEIVNEGKVPRGWIKDLEKKFLKYNTPKRQYMAKKEILKRLDNLIEYFKSTPLVKDKETRDILLDRLRKTRTSWEEKEWEEIIAG